MKKVLVDINIVESIEYMRSQDGVSLYGIIKSINEGCNSELFNSHSEKLLKYFNDFDNREDDENFMNCMLGNYGVKGSDNISQNENTYLELTKDDAISLVGILEMSKANFDKNKNFLSIMITDFQNKIIENFK